jgi:hypothetical protein
MRRAGRSAAKVTRLASAKFSCMRDPLARGGFCPRCSGAAPSRKLATQKAATYSLRFRPEIALAGEESLLAVQLSTHEKLITGRA